MHVSTILASLIGLVGLTLAGRSQDRPDAAPAAPAERHIPSEWTFHPYHANNTHSQAKRGALGMYECHSKNWYGPCTWTKADGGSCHNWIYGPGGSMGPDNGLTCTIYDDFNCANSELHLDWFQAPGIPDYQKNQWLISNLMSSGPMSYKCKKL